MRSACSLVVASDSEHKVAELELPQVSFGRYLELLKRRWWQVIPITVFGLIAGAVAAFLIPRFYVAETTVFFRGGAALDPGIEDPMLALVGLAQQSIPTKTEEVLVKLGWPEAADEDEERRRDFITDVEGRIRVSSLGMIGKQANTVTLAIQFKDINGERAAEFANTVRDVWTDGERMRIETQARQELEEANRNVRSEGIALQNAQTTKRNHIELHGIDPSLASAAAQAGGPSVVVPQQNPLYAQRSTLTLERAKTDRNIAALKGRIDELDVNLSNGMIPARVKAPQPEIVPDNQAEVEFQKLVGSVAMLQKKLQGMTATNPQYETVKAQLALLQPKLEAELKARNAKFDYEIDNQAYLDAKRNIALWKADLKGLEKELALIDAEIERLDGEIAEQPKIWGKYWELEGKITQHQTTLDEYRAIARDKLARFQQLRTSKSFRTLKTAVVPPRPTDPSIVLVALAGSLIGLATAIGVILLLDFLQSSFKTLDDVERALPVPVLGALAHLETFEERTRTVAHRRRVSLAASVFLFLSLSVTMIYFFDPTKLPPIVASVFDVLFGSVEQPPK